MLLEISVRNIALIESVRVEFTKGFNVLTGETGAGKSILVDSLALALGGKADKDMLRTGANRAQVEALFDISQNAEARQALQRLGIEDMDGCALVARELTDAGRTISRVNGSVVNLAELKKLTAYLVDMHGQHEHQALLDSEKHLLFLDAFGGEAHRARIEDVAQLYAKYRALKQEIEKLSLDSAEKERMRDMLRFQIEEINAVKPKSGEYEKLEEKDKLYRNSEKLAESLQAAYRFVYAGEGKMLSAQDTLHRAAEAMAKIADVAEPFEKLRARLEELYYAVQEVGYELQDAKDSFEYDPTETDRIADRIDSLKKLMRKYGPEMEDVISFRDDAKEKLLRIETSDARIQELQVSLKDAEEALRSACDALTEQRKCIAKDLEARLLSELSQLGMGRSRFEVRFARKKEYSELGLDEARFLLSPNPGEAMKPLSAIASGGELSRIMLAMKAISADTVGVDSMIFDEIDSGVSGRMAQIVGEKMASIADRRQVICITHLPQIACLADAQYRIEKTVTDGRTGSSVTRLDEDGRVEEIARLVGGAGDPESGRAHARNMLEAARNLRGKV